MSIVTTTAFILVPAIVFSPKNDRLEDCGKSNAGQYSDYSEFKLQRASISDSVLLGVASGPVTIDGLVPEIRYELLVIEAKRVARKRYKPGN